jgi:hypothetical protein
MMRMMFVPAIEYYIFKWTTNFKIVSLTIVLLRDLRESVSLNKQITLDEPNHNMSTFFFHPRGPRGRGP